MSYELTVGRAEPRSKTVKTVVIFLHGYGADGQDLLGLAQPLGEHLRDTLFLAPNAPEPCVNNPMGFQWFPIPHMDGSDPIEAGRSFSASVDILNRFLDQVIEIEGVPASHIMLVGFSQGTMMSLHVAPRRDVALAGVVGFSGRLLEPDRLAEAVKVRLPIQLLHGDRDPLVPYEEMQAAAEALVAEDFEVFTHTMEGTPHGISPDGLSQAYVFMNEYLPKDAAT